MDNKLKSPEKVGQESKIAVVTGGGGGIGRSICRELAKEGYAVVVADRASQTLNEFASSLPRVRLDQEHHTFAEDLTDLAGNQRLSEYARELGQVTLLVNAIGISPKRNGEKIPFNEMGPDTWDEIMKTNLYAPFYAMQTMSPLMPEDGSASILNITSVTAKTGTGGYPSSGFVPAMPSSAAYGATKAALANLTISLAHELADRNIRVNAVAPGYVETKMMGTVERTSDLLSTVPMGRFAKPEEVANAVRFLASEQAAFMTGATVEVNGGWTSM